MSKKTSVMTNDEVAKIIWDELVEVDNVTFGVLKAQTIKTKSINSV